MLDINFIRENKERVEKAAQEKSIAVDIDELISLDDSRKKLAAELDEFNRRRKEHAAGLSAGKPNAEQLKKGKDIKTQAAKIEEKLKKLEVQIRAISLFVPNIYSDDTPLGSDESGNKELRTWGDKPQFTFAFKDHITLGEELDLIDVERGVKVSGFRGYYLKNEAMRLQWALFSYCLDVMREKGFTQFITPTMIREMALIGSGHFPATREESYAVDDNFLAGTSEPSLLAYRADEIIEKNELPLKYCAISPCYRREIGSYGKDTRGLYRVHEFWKVEQVVITENDFDVSIPLFEEMLNISETILQKLELPYRVIQICTGDMGAGKYKMYDIETWMPSRKSYGETHSCSHLTDWQSRRLNMRYKDESGNTVYPHAMNNTVIASPRILIAILENYQNEDGTISVPKVLQNYLGGLKKIGS